MAYTRTHIPLHEKDLPKVAVEILDDFVRYATKNFKLANVEVVSDMDYVSHSNVYKIVITLKSAW